MSAQAAFVLCLVQSSPLRSVRFHILCTNMDVCVGFWDYILSTDNVPLIKVNTNFTTYSFSLSVVLCS